MLGASGRSDSTPDKTLSPEGERGRGEGRKLATTSLGNTLGVAVDPFSEAELRYRDLVEERRVGTLQARAFRVAVRDLAVLDGEGRRWMLGPEDGIWYRRERERWLQADPPRRLVCSSCGHHNLGRHSFCVECGHRLNR